MKRIFVLITMLLILLPAIPSLAQEDDMCSADQIVERIGAAYETYADDASGDGNFEESLRSIDTLSAEIEAIYAECDEARYQAYITEGTELLDMLQEGGYVIYVRHAATNKSEEDTDLASCETQRNLSTQGREDAAMIGEIWATLDVPVSQIISTEYCRTRETAQSAFGEPTVITKEELLTSLDEWLAEIPEDGTNVIIVGHVDLLEDATGIQIPEDIRFSEGDALVYKPEGGAMGDGGYELVTRISLQNWFDLGRIVAEMNME